MKRNDVVRYENRHFVILEILPSGNYGCRCINDGEKHTLRPNEVVMVKEYVRPTQPLKTKVRNASRWFFSNKFDSFLKILFFTVIKYVVILGAALIVALPFILLL